MRTFLFCFGLVSVVLMAPSESALAQGLPGTEDGEWRYLGGDAAVSYTHLTLPTKA